MTQEKMRKVIAACVSAATVLLTMLLGYLIYQWSTIAVYNKRIDKLEMEIAQLEQIIATGEENLEYYQSKFYLDQKVLELQMLLEKNK
jgi:hypothetical protein